MCTENCHRRCRPHLHPSKTHRTRQNSESYLLYYDLKPRITTPITGRGAQSGNVSMTVLPCRNERKSRATARRLKIIPVYSLGYKRGLFAGQRFDLVRCLLVRNFLLTGFLHGKMASSRGRVCRKNELLLREIDSFGSHIYKKNFNHLCSQKENVWSCWYQGKESHRTLSAAGAILKPHHDDDVH